MYRTDYILKTIMIMVLVSLSLFMASCIDKRDIQKFDDIENYGTYPGVFIGAYLGCDHISKHCESITKFNQETGKSHAIFSRYLDIKASKNQSYWAWAEEVKRNGAVPMFIYDPMTGLDDIDTNNVEYFAEKSRELNITVFIVFGHEMNLKKFPWGNQPDKFKEKFKLVADIFHKIAPNVKMVWLPNQNWGYPWGGINYGDGYSEYYPDGKSEYGDYVDWVGLNIYDRDWDENNKVTGGFFISNIRKGNGNIDFYETFAVGKNKPMLIGEIGSFDPNEDPTNPGERDVLNYSKQVIHKNEWIKQVYNTSTLMEFPMLRVIIYFDTNRNETIGTKNHKFNVSTDYSIPHTPNIYGDLISNSYFIKARSAFLGR